MYYDQFFSCGSKPLWSICTRINFFLAGAIKPLWLLHAALVAQYKGRKYSGIKSVQCNSTGFLSCNLSIERICQNIAKFSHDRPRDHFYSTQDLVE